MVKIEKIQDYTFATYTKETFWIDYGTSYGIVYKVNQFLEKNKDKIKKVIDIKYCTTVNEAIITNPKLKVKEYNTFVELEVGQEDNFQNFKKYEGVPYLIHEAIVIYETND